MKSLTLASAVLAILFLWVANSLGQETGTRQPHDTKPVANVAPKAVSNFIENYCLDCHGESDVAAELSLAPTNLPSIISDPATWETIVRRLRTRQMPPASAARPDDDTYRTITGQIERTLDDRASSHLNPGREEAIRTLTRTEYQNAVRDLLSLNVDATRWLPKDSSSHGFDNVTTAALTPTRLARYMTAAEQIARRAIGSTEHAPDASTFRVPADRTQEAHVPGLPLGTRGGVLIDYHVPSTADYKITIRLARDRNEEVEGLRGKHELVLLLDRKPIDRFTVQPPKDKDFSKVDAHLQADVRLEAGEHRLGVTFLKKPASIVETKRQPFDAHFNMHRHPRISPAIFEVSIVAAAANRTASVTPSRELLLSPLPMAADDEEGSARRTLSRIMRLAYRRPIATSELDRQIGFYREGRAEGQKHEAGIERALTSILASPHFFLRVELDADKAADNAPVVDAGSSVVSTTQVRYRKVSDVELATRLSFFIWSSIPDDRLLSLAEEKRLSNPPTLRHQVDRMLADPRADSLVTNFGSQWLYLRNLAAATVDVRLYPDFDDNLRQSFRKETEQLLRKVIQERRPLIELIAADYTFMDERLAQHYGVPQVRGSRFRRVSDAQRWHRGGLLRHGSIQTVTSYATRTSPVLRGNWILKNLVGTPAPPPPPDVPALEDNTVDADLPMRAQLAVHRANAACAVCHDLIDPVGFALENYDAVGRWREFERGRPIDASGGFPDGSVFEGVAGIEQALVAHPEVLAHTVTEKLLTYALGRGVEYYDQPAVRKIVRRAAESDYALADLVHGIVQSVPFQMRSTR